VYRKRGECRNVEQESENDREEAVNEAKKEERWSDEEGDGGGDVEEGYKRCEVEGGSVENRGEESKQQADSGMWVEEPAEGSQR
jgi:hypothetical protein